MSVVLNYYSREELLLCLLSLYRSVLLTVLQNLGSFSNHSENCISFRYYTKAVSKFLLCFLAQKDAYQAGHSHFVN